MSGNLPKGSSPDSSRSRKGTLFALILIVLAAIWLFYVAIASGYNEAGIFLLGMLTAILAITLFWETRLKKTKAVLSIAALVAILFFGYFSIKIGKYQQKVNDVIARHMIVSVGKALEQYIIDGHPLPDCNWKCMKQELMNKGYWKELHIPYRGQDQSIPFKGIPLKDGWGCRYLYQNLGQGNFILKSSGADRRFFTENDIIYQSGDPSLVPLPKVPVFLRKKPQESS